MRQNRRDLLKAALAAPAAALGRPSKRKLIESENRKPGTRDWQLTRVRLDKDGGFRSPWIEGYCSRQSVKAGESIDIMVSTDPPCRYQIEIFRTGYYGGLGARQMTSLGPFQGKAQSLPPVAARRLRECHWEPATTLQIPEDWLSGVYLGRLTLLTDNSTSAPWQSYVIFIVRDEREADILLQCSDNTWQAYNRWPDDYSLYIHPRGSLTGDVDVSFDRPYGKYCQIYENPQSVGSGEFLCWEFPLTYWLEQHGYDVTYCSNLDMTEPACVARARIFVSQGHDEYWDLRQYQNAKAAIGHGKTELYLCGDSVCFVSPFQPSTDGRPNRIITRAGRYGKLRPGEEGYGPFKTEGPEQNMLVGGRSMVPGNGGSDWIVTRPDHWIFEGTGMRKGERIPGLVGWEFHGDPPELPGLEVLAEGIALSGGTRPNPWAATIYPGPRKNFVFNASSIWWAQGLASPPGHMLPWSHWTRPHGPDQRVQRITQNVLRRALV
ncbi:MAG TPA: N,N-dimethylformamidase beta subunit family domain-containing protein [Bryobacteraceae bacterium]|nr:N,N-dimethylformamidase beta subunit family domain-containing protein [Bryobacteraceae bacterium]